MFVNFRLPLPPSLPQIGTICDRCWSHVCSICSGSIFWIVLLFIEGCPRPVTAAPPVWGLAVCDLAGITGPVYVVERAFRRARFFVSVGLWVCGYGCLLCCVVARSDAKPSCMLCCGVVGLWCVCVFYWPHGSQKAPQISFVRQLLPKPNKNGTKIDHKWDQYGPGGGEGATEK